MLNSLDFKKFYKIETGFRKELSYPPYRKIINIRFDGTSRQRVESCAKEAGKFARQLLSGGDYSRTVEVLGPASALWVKIKGRYRYQMLGTMIVFALIIFATMNDILFFSRN